MRLDWARDGSQWPHRDSSRFLDAGGVHWHVQRQGGGPSLLLLHGTGSSVHSWRALLPALAARFDVIAVDLPGHGFSSLPDGDGSSLQGMAASLAALVERLDLKPVAIVGHSAGAAIAVQMVLGGQVRADAVFGINGAFAPLRGVPGLLFPPIARLLATSETVARLSAWRSKDRAAVERLILQTGSRLDDVGVDLYARLLRSPGHVQGALGMMARWDLVPLQRELPRFPVPLHLLVGDADRAVPPRLAERVRALAPVTTLTTLAGLGHLAHEEAPERVADWIAERMVCAVDA